MQELRQEQVWLPRFYLALLVSLPFSLSLDLGAFQLQIPSEPLMILIALLLLKQCWDDPKIIMAHWRHPLCLSGMAYLTWMGLMIPFSTMPIVSLKYWLITILHWWVFFVGFWLLAKKHWANRGQDYFFWWFSAYALPFAALLLYAWTVHAQYDFRIDTSLLAARPFYFDHTMYSTCILFLLFCYAVWSFPNSGLSKKKIYLSRILLPLFLIGLYLSFCRAAWLSLLLTGVLWLLIVLFRFRLAHLIGLLVVSIIALFMMADQLTTRLSTNTYESKKGSLSEQILSIGNLSNDVSNLERLNRYSCAWRMSLDKPLTGFGAGTFPVQYLPYQRAEEMTRISVTTTGPHPPGRGGSTHSEYLRALAEVGWPGLLAFFGILLFSLQSGLEVYHSASPKAIRYLALALTLALMSFFIHTLFNNFLHTDKVAIFFWSMQAALLILVHRSCLKMN